MVTWTATDDSDNMVRDTQIVTVQDMTPPVFGETYDRSVAFRQGQTFTVDYDMPDAYDAVYLSQYISSCTLPSGSTFALGQNTVTCTATDYAGNVATTQFLITVSLSTLPGSTVLFSDNFEDGNLNGWTVRSVYHTWMAERLHDNVVPQGYSSSNKAAEAEICDTTCTLEMTSGVSIPAGNSTATLQFYRYVDVGLDPGEYLKAEVYNGTSWMHLDSWTPEESENDGIWQFETYDLSGYAGVSDFKVRFVGQTSSDIEHVAVDDVKISVQ